MPQEVKPQRQFLSNCFRPAPAAQIIGTSRLFRPTERFFPVRNKKLRLDRAIASGYNNEVVNYFFALVAQLDRASAS